MSRYQPLADFLSSREEDYWEAGFVELESMLGFPLPQSAYNYPAWWANQTSNGHSQTKGWRNAGWRTRNLDLAAQRIRFERDNEKDAAASFSRRDGKNLSELEKQAMTISGITERNALFDEALRALIAREAASRLIRLGGTMSGYAVPDRERPPT